MTFTIRKEQAEAYRSHMIDGFAERGVAYLRTHLAEPTAPYPDSVLSERVRRCITRAGRYGLKTEKQVVAFAAATFLIGERFDDDPEREWAVAILRASRLTAEERADTLLWAAWNSDGRDGEN
jgi:hypothetical protein